MIQLRVDCISQLFAWSLSSCIQGCYGGHNYHYFTRIASDLSIYSDGRGMTRDSVDAFIVSLEFCYREIVIGF